MDSKRYMNIFLNRGEWSNLVGCYLRSSWYANIEKIPCPKWQINYINIHQNHSKIKKGIAYWVRLNEICTGYRLKSNQEIVRPIYQPQREFQLTAIREDIKLTARFFAARARRYLYKQVLLEKSKIPEDVIKIILAFSWDPNLLI